MTNSGPSVSPMRLMVLGKILSFRATAYGFRFVEEYGFAPRLKSSP